jgi:hypothetical protein
MTMKRIKYIIIMFLTLSAITGCKKFLDEESQDEVRPATVDELTQLMSAEGYPYLARLNLVGDLLTDDVQCNGSQNQDGYLNIIKKGKSVFTWSKDMYQELKASGGVVGTQYVNSWQTLYKKISGCNVVLAYVDKMQGPLGQAQNLKGQALAMRAFYYFQLVNLYGKPYNTSGVDPETSPGVPIKLQMEVTDSLFKRNSVAAVYRQIESDLKQGTGLMEVNPITFNKYKMSAMSANALLSRVYLYQEKWDQAIEYANKVIAVKPGLTQLSSFKMETGLYIFNSTQSTSDHLYGAATSTEIIWAYQVFLPAINLIEDEFLIPSSFNPALSNTLNSPYAPSQELLSLYDTRPQSENTIYLADLRARAYFKANGYFAPTGIGFKLTGYDKWGLGIRVSEMYLNRAEANIRKFISSGNDAFRLAALADINMLRVARYDTRKPYQPIAITDAQALLSFYKDERRRELCFEDHRWNDLRRYGMPQISHRYEEAPGTGQTITLAQGDNRYTLPIPKEVLERNAQLTQNP